MTDLALKRGVLYSATLSGSACSSPGDCAAGVIGAPWPAAMLRIAEVDTHCFDPAIAARENLQMASLIVITGPPGAGKSTVAALVAKQSDPSVLIEGDAFFAFLDQGATAPWLTESHAQNDVVTLAAAAAAGRFAIGYTTVYDGVIGPWFLATFARATGLATLHYVILMPSVESCVERVLTREGHGFTDETATCKMHVEFSRASIAERHVFRDPPGTPDAVADEVLARVKAGELTYEP